jgi:hypothetical protein
MPARPEYSPEFVRHHLRQRLGYRGRVVIAFRASGKLTVGPPDAKTAVSLPDEPQSEWRLWKRSLGVGALLAIVGDYPPREWSKKS